MDKWNGAFVGESDWRRIRLVQCTEAVKVPQEEIVRRRQSWARREASEVFFLYRLVEFVVIKRHKNRSGKRTAGKRGDGCCVS